MKRLLERLCEWLTRFGFKPLNPGHREIAPQENPFPLRRRLRRDVRRRLRALALEAVRDQGSSDGAEAS